MSDILGFLSPRWRLVRTIGGWIGLLGGSAAIAAMIWIGVAEGGARAGWAMALGLVVGVQGFLVIFALGGFLGALLCAFSEYLEARDRGITRETLRIRKRIGDIPR